MYAFCIQYSNSPRYIVIRRFERDVCDAILNVRHAVRFGFPPLSRNAQQFRLVLCFGQESGEPTSNEHVKNNIRRWTREEKGKEHTQKTQKLTKNQTGFLCHCFCLFRCLPSWSSSCSMWAAFTKYSIDFTVCSLHRRLPRRPDRIGIFLRQVL